MADPHNNAGSDFEAELGNSATQVASFGDERQTLVERIQHALHRTPAVVPLVVLLVSLAVFAALLGSKFFSPFALTLILQQVQIVGILAAAQSLIILTAGIDLSVGAIAVLCSVVMGQFTFRYVYAVGDDPEAAELAGVQVDRTLISVYALAGLICALAGWVMIGRFGSISPSLSTGQIGNIQSITAVVIGGISLFGGRGSILGAFFGALIVGVFELGLRMAGADAQWTYLQVDPDQGPLRCHSTRRRRDSARRATGPLRLPAGGERARDRNGLPESCTFAGALDRRQHVHGPRDPQPGCARSVVSQARSCGDGSAGQTEAFRSRPADDPEHQPGGRDPLRRPAPGCCRRARRGVRVQSGDHG